MGFDIGIDCRCDSCGEYIGRGAPIYCSKCHTAFIAENQILRRELQDLGVAPDTLLSCPKAPALGEEVLVWPGRKTA